MGSYGQLLGSCPNTSEAYKRVTRMFLYNKIYWSVQQHSVTNMYNDTEFGSQYYCLECSISTISPSIK